MKYEVESLRTGRHREWRIQLDDPDLEPVPARLHPREAFVPYLVTIYISAPHDAAPFSHLKVRLFGQDAGPWTRAADYNNDAPNSEYSIRLAPAWVKQLVADVTGEPRLINTFDESASRWCDEATYSLHAPRDPAYPDPLPVFPAEFWEDEQLVAAVAKHCQQEGVGPVLEALAIALAAGRNYPERKKRR